MPLFIILIAYLVLLSIWMILAVLIIGHLLQYAGSKPSVLFAIAVFISGSILILTLSAVSLMSIDWQYTIPIFTTL